LWFRSELVSPKHIDSMAILAAARIPVPMELLVGTVLHAQVLAGC
jgi:hypothetical protein